MTISSDGIIAYGIPLGEDSEYFPWNKHKWEGDWEKWLAAVVIGFDEDWETYENYFGKRRELLKAYPLDMVYYCSYDYPMNFLAVRGTEIRCSRGEAVLIKELPKVHDGQRTALSFFAEEHGLKYDQVKVGWHLLSMYG